MISSTHRSRADTLFWTLSWLALAVHLGFFLDAPESVGMAFYQGLLISTYALMFLAPAWLISKLARPLPRGAQLALHVVLTTAVQLLLYADGLLWKLYGFHLNGFVWNIITTPGGIAALGSSESSYLGFALIGLGFVGGQLALRLLASALTRILPRLPVPRLAWALTLFMVGTLTERVSHAVSHFYGYSPLLETAQRLPLYQPLTMREFFVGTLGMERPQSLEVENVAIKGRLAYPQAPLQIQPPAKPLNLVWLVAESWRADTLNPRVMPQTNAFAAESLRYSNHFSGGNGTRMGLFSQFYSLPASLWFPVLNARVGSPLIDVLQQQDYQMRLFTSAKFTYPEFDKTLFVRVPQEQMQAYGEGETWQRDRKNIDDLLAFIDQRDSARPFMTFMFFESPHANYNFPPESVIEPDYLADFSYASMDLERDIGGIHKRYLNAVHHLDGQIARVVDHLKARADGKYPYRDYRRPWRRVHGERPLGPQLDVLRRTDPRTAGALGAGPRAPRRNPAHQPYGSAAHPVAVAGRPESCASVRHRTQPVRSETGTSSDCRRLGSPGVHQRRAQGVLPFATGNFTALQATRADDLALPNAMQVVQQTLPSIRSQLQGIRRFMAH